MSAAVCSVVRSEVPILHPSHVTCRPDQDIKSAYNVQNLKCSEMPTSSCDYSQSVQNDVTEQLHTLALAALNIMEPEQEDVQSGSSAGEEDDQLPSESLIVTRNELILESRSPRSHSPINCVRKFGNDVVDAIDDAVHVVEYVTKKVMQRPNSVLELPENNLHLIHHVTKQTIGFGLHLEEHEVRGCQVARVIENGLADRSELQCGDIIKKINGFDTSDAKFADMAKLFTEIDVREKITLVVHRVETHDNGDVVIYDVEIIITLTLSDDNVKCEVEVDVTATYLKYQSTTNLKYIQQNPSNRSPKYLKEDGNHICMSTFLDPKCHFLLELYQGGSRHPVCVLRNNESSNIIDQRRRSTNQLTAIQAPQPTRSVIKNPDTKFFYRYPHPEFRSDDVFESVTMRNYFINVTEGSLVLQRFSRASQVPSSGRFRIVNV